LFLVLVLLCQYNSIDKLSILIYHFYYFNHRADEARAESLVILEQLSALKAERLRLTFHTSNADFTSAEALQFLEGFNTEDNVDEMGIMGRMGFKNSIRDDIETFSLAEQEFENRMQEKENVDNQAAVMMRELERSEKNVRDAQVELDEARRRLEMAQQQLSDFQSRVTEVQRDISNINLTVRRADQELNKSDQHLKRKRDVVRRALKRKDEIYGEPMNTFDTGSDGNVRLNSAFDRSSPMNDARYEDETMAQIDQLRRQEADTEAEFLMLVEKASRLVSRSERLRLRSEALIGKQSDDNVMEQSMQSNNGGVDPAAMCIFDRLEL
jgi:chromosome segregation ATPase